MPAPKSSPQSPAEVLPTETTTRQQIVAATSRLLEAQGYHGTGLNQIIRESGAPRGSLYYYFPAGKEELAAEAIAQQGEGMAAFTARLLGEVEDPAAAVDHFLQHLIAYTQGSSYCAGAPLAAVALETAGSSERLRAACAGAYANLRQPFVERLLGGGYAPKQAEALGTLIVAALEGGVILSRAQQRAEPLEQVRGEIARLMAVTPRGVT
jgi:TetR/AcrR family transcriptional repressor of lmrAB and yxaGH operons